MSERELEALDLLPCPHCGATLIRAAHSAFHPDGDCWLSAEFEVDECDYESWNRRASPTPEGGGGERDAFEVWAHADHRRIEPEEYEERTPDNNHYYADDSTNQAYVGWCAALLSSPRVEDVRRDALEEAATVADETQASAREEVASDKEEMGEDYDPYSFGAGFLSGEITASINIGTAIRSLSPPDGDGKQEQATRSPEDGRATAPTDRL